MKNIVSTALISALFLAAAAPAMAETQWQKDHPRRAEVNQRLANERAKTRNEVASGKLTGQQAHQLNKEDRQIRREERSMAAQNGGHITRQEQRTLNQQENAVNAQRRADIRANGQ